MRLLLQTRHRALLIATGDDATDNPSTYTGSASAELSVASGTAAPTADEALSKVEERYGFH